MSVTSDQVRELITAVGLEHRASEIMSLLQTGIAIHTSPTDDSKIAIGQSKFGGMPDLPLGIAWPDYQGRPLDFVAQINLVEVSQYNHDQRLPSAGWLYFYFDERKYYEDELWKQNGKGSYHVSYFDGNLSSLKHYAAPNNLETKYVACMLTFSEVLTLPDVYSYEGETILGWKYENRREYEQDIGAYYNLLEQLMGEEADDNRIFGYPNIIQGDVMMEAEAAAHNLQLADCNYDLRGNEIKTWQLLLQIDSDRNAKMVWGDVGRLYYCIQLSALHERLFDAVVCIIQCTCAGKESNDGRGLRAGDRLGGAGCQRPTVG